MESSDQVGSVSSFGAVERSMMEDFAFGVVLILKQFIQFGYKSIGFTQIEGAKVSEEWFINEVLKIGQLLRTYAIYIEKECISLVFGRVFVRNPIQAAYKDLERFS